MQADIIGPDKHSFTHCLTFATNIRIGSVNFTPGQAYDECDDGKRSAVHCDMVKILTGDGELRFDDTLIHKGGRFVQEPLLGLNLGDYTCCWR